jgi:hypothetical protein
LVTDWMGSWPNEKSRMSGIVMGWRLDWCQGPEADPETGADAGKQRLL